MNTKQFLGTVLGAEGYYCVAGFKDGNVIQKFYSSLDAVAETAVNFDLEGRDAYFALSTFVEDTNRKTVNVRQLKTFFLDIDCGGSKPYATQHSALLALREFYLKYGLPRPIVVNSGYGLHVYWVLDKPCTREEWLPVANSLKAACLQDGLEIDASITSDAARILRVPNTHNFKGTPPKQVKILLESKAAVSLQEFSSLLPTELTPVLSTRAYSDEDTKDMARAVGQNKYIKKFANLLVKTASGNGCAQINKAIMQPNDMTYPEWLHALSIAKHCDVDGEQAIHLISSRYDGYSVEETEKVAASIESPHLCATFEKDNPSGCEECPHKKKIKTPITLCRELREAENNIVEIPIAPTEVMVADEDEDEDAAAPPPPLLTKKHAVPSYPFPYIRLGEGGVGIKVRDKDGNIDEQEIYKRDLYISKRMFDPLDGPCYEFTHHTKREGIRTFVVASVVLSSPDGFRKAMGENDIFILAKDAEKLMRYIGAWIEELMDDPIVVVKTQFGWTEDNKSFVLGDKEVFASHVGLNPPGSRTAQYISFFEKKGTLEGWKRVTEFYNQPGFEEHQMMFGLSFGSPLMDFVPGISGGIFHLTSSETGIGKTTGMWGGASVWGNPKKLVLIGKDTPNSAWNRAEILKDVVLYIDEVSNYGPEDASDFCYAISDGMQKNRMSNKGENAERFRGEPWNLNCGSSGNSSIVETASKYRASPKGESGRVIEATATKKLFTTEEAIKANSLNEDLAANYGHAGRIYITHVLQNLSAVKKLVADTRTMLMTDAELGTQERHWIAQCATVFAGCTIAKQLDLISWDLDALYNWMIKKLRALKMNLDDMNIDIEDIISNFLTDHPRGILRVKSTDDARDPEIENIIDPRAGDTPLYRWAARVEYDINKLYIVPKVLKAWCVKHQHHYSAIRELIFAKLNGKATKMRLGKGTKMVLPPSHVIECSWSKELSVGEEGFDAGTAD
tara:strand:+ start:2728 stop:5613 length:2886 start_codon:yes stop_codon:yes gene_type:complete